MSDEKPWRTNVVIAGAIACAGLAVGSFSLFRGEDTRSNIPEAASKAADDAISRRLTENCIADRRFRLAYRERAIKERRLSHLQFEANSSLKRVADDLAREGEAIPSIIALGAKLGEVNEQLERIRQSLQIYPVPKCGESDSRPQPSRRDARKADTESKGSTDDATQGTTPIGGAGDGPEPAGPAPGGGGDGDVRGGGLPTPPPDPPAPEPPTPDPDPPAGDPDPDPPAEPPSTVGGTGLDVPLVKECDLLPALCSQP